MEPAYNNKSRTILTMPRSLLSSIISFTSLFQNLVTAGTITTPNVKVVLFHSFVARFLLIPAVERQHLVGHKLRENPLRRYVQPLIDKSVREDLPQDDAPIVAHSPDVQILPQHFPTPDQIVVGQHMQVFTFRGHPFERLNILTAQNVHHRERIVLDILGDAERRDPRRFAARDYHPCEDFVDEFQLDQTDVEDFSRGVSPSGDRIFGNRPGVERPVVTAVAARESDIR
jgi:hypothetical protein